MTDLDRRKVIELIGVGSITGLAGCGGNGGENTTTSGGGGGGGGDETTSGGGGDDDGIPDGTQMSVETQYYHEWEDGRNDNDMGYTMTAEPGAAVGEFPCEFSPDNASWMREYGLMIANGADDLGIDGTTVSNPFTQLVDGWVNKGLNYPVVMIPQAPEPQRAADPHAFLGRKYCGRSNNFQNYCNPEYEELLDEQLQETNLEDRRELVAEAQRRWVQDEIQGWPYFPAILSPVNTRDFEGYFPMPGAGVSRDNYPWSFLTIQPTGDRTTFIKGTMREMGRPNFMWSTSDVASTWMTLVWDSLFDIGPELDVIPGLATSAEFVDDTTVEIELRDGVTWHDGESFGPEDVVWSTEAFMDPPASNIAAYFDNLVEDNPVEVASEEGGGAVQFNLQSPDARFTTQAMVRNVILPKHQWENADNPPDFEPDPPIGTGPLQWNSWDPGTRFELDAYKDNWMWDDEFQQEYLGDYYTEGDGIDKFILVNTGNIDSTIGALQQGDIDAISGELGVSQAQRAAEADHVELIQADNFVGVNTSMDHTIPIIRDKEFRIAFARYSWNVEEFQQNAMQGFGKLSKSNNPIVDTSPWYTDDTIEREYDVDQARSILESAGYTWDDDGNLQYPDGEAWAAFVERTKPGNTNQRREELGQPDFS